MAEGQNYAIYTCHCGLWHSHSGSPIKNCLRVSKKSAMAPPFNNTATKMSLFWVQKLYNMLTLKQKIQKYMKIQFSILILEKTYGHQSFFPISFRIQYLEFGKHLKNRRLHDLVLTERQVCGNGTLLHQLQNIGHPRS